MYKFSDIVSLRMNVRNDLVMYLLSELYWDAGPLRIVPTQLDTCFMMISLVIYIIHRFIMKYSDCC